MAALPQARITFNYLGQFDLTGLADGFMLKASLVILVTLVFSLSSYIGISSGMQRHLVLPHLQLSWRCRSTTGTTATTALDPLEPIGRIARAHGLWLHVDSAMAGSAMILPECRWMWTGISN